MKSRISITLDPVVHRRAKSAARRRGTTVSGLIESLLAGSVAQDGSLVDQMLGSGELRDSPAGADPLYDRIKTKYLRP